jgi:hypothetical protein
LGLLLGDLFSLSFSIFSVVPALPAPSSPSHSSSWKEDSFDIDVLLEPFSETDSEGTSGIQHNMSLETSLKNRKNRLQRENSIFLLDRNETYWNDIKHTLDQAPSQKEYIRLLEFENRDLQIRELKQECFAKFQKVLSEHPALSENAPYNPQEALVDFFDENRAKLETTHPQCNTAEKDRMELLFLDKVGQDIRKHGPDSFYMRQIFSNK